jgi:hypothetical protein
VKTVEFVFGINDRVIDPLGGEGIISMAALDDGEKKTYFVKNGGGGTWWNESDLKLKEVSK